MSAFRLSVFAAALLGAGCVAAMRSAGPAEDDAFVLVSTPVGYSDDFRGSLKQAKREGKVVMAVFAGSDWCRWCRKFERDVIGRDEFLDAVTNRVTPVFVDSPVDKLRLTPAARRENPRLADRYGIDDRPLLLLIDAKGREIWRDGYSELPPAEYAARVLEHVPAAERKP